MNDRETARAYWNDRSSDYDANIGAAYEEAYRKTTEKMLAYLTPDSRVLELACGTGLVTLPIAQQVERVCAIDISDEMLRRLREKLTEQSICNVCALRTEIFDPALREGSFDAVLACNVLHYLKDRAAVLARIHALLKPEGVFLSATDCLGEGSTPERESKRQQVEAGKLPYVAFDTMRGLEREITAAGFTVLETESLFPAPPNLFVAAKKR